jgi:hypothetical protein
MTPGGSACRESDPSHRAGARPGRQRRVKLLPQERGIAAIRRRRELFPPDRALQPWMAAAPLAAGASAASLVAVVGWPAAAVQWRLAAGVELLAGLAALCGMRSPQLDRIERALHAHVREESYR